jgi:ABC-type antimicrobial peptide transport system permease subunit
LSPSSKVEKVVLTYYDSEEPDRLRQTPRPLDVVGWIDLKGAADDPGLTPEFPGITDRPSPRNWDPPPSLHYDKKRVTDADERYWQRFRTTPKAYVSLATGQSLWGSRFGKLTSIRLAPPVGKAVDLDEAAKKFEQALLHHLVPEKGGLVFDAIRERALRASSGGTDFGKLFLYFSVFLIVAALLLVGLLFRLNLDRRASEIGVLLATGVPRGTVRRLWLVEGLSLAALGALFGSLGAIGYAGLLLDYLRASWPGGIDASFLRLHGTFTSYAIGYFSALLVSGLTIVWATWVLGRVSPRALLGGETAETVERASGPRGTKLRLIVAGVCLAGAVACLVAGPSVSDHELQAMTFFSSGFLLLIAGMIGVWSLLSRKRLGESRSVFALAMRNAGRHPVRSLLTVGLLASATFLIVAVQSFHRAAGEDFARRDGGSGGFTLFGESEVPLFLELQSQRAQDDLDFALRLANVKEAEKEALRGVESYSFRLRAGDDASCLNLAQPRRPRVLGVSQSFIERGGFRFQSNEGGRQYQKTPWRMLELDTFAIEGAIPVIADATTAKWMLKTGLGEELTVPAENGELVRLRIVGLLQDSIFQSELLMSEANFRKLYPRQGGYQFFLIDAPAEKASQVRELLETGLAGHGLTVLPTRQRVEAYLAVENTYLATFQALGGLGLLLGALGLAVVLLRSVWERRAELALLRALGFRRATLGRLILAENSYLLTLGLGVGLAAALLSVLPHLLEGTGRVVVLRLLALLAGVLLAGLMAGAAAVAATLRAPLLPALRRE